MTINSNSKRDGSFAEVEVGDEVKVEVEEEDEEDWFQIQKASEVQDAHAN